MSKIPTMALRQKILTLAACLCVCPTTVLASVPPASWKPATYVGPGLLCGDGFTLRMNAGETATMGFASEGYVPLYVKSNGGEFGIISYAVNRPTLDMTLIARRTGGTISVVDRVIRSFASGVGKRKSYWFQPADVSRPPFSLDFYEAVSGSGGWGEFPAASYQAVVERLEFAAPGEGAACLAPAR
jgi:hypothetical protein